MKENSISLNIDDISYDTDNPRIKMALVKYGYNINAEQIYFALRSAEDGQRGSSSYNALKDSIRASDGIVSSITVVTNGDQYKCIDGNTRLAIYKQLYKEDGNENWIKIKSIVLSDANQRDIETIRVSAHLVGAREWPAYEKARYLHYLHSEKFMDYNEMIALCGGKKIEIERQIDAFHDMNEYYRDVVDESAFQIDRFSGFVELQKTGIKESIFEAGLGLENFGQWIGNGMIYRLDTVRDLPKVLRDEEAKKIFLKGGPRSIEEATQILGQRKRAGQDASDKEMTLDSATLPRLVDTLTQRINNMPIKDLRILQDKADEEIVDQIASLENLSSCLQRLLADVSE